MLLTIISPDASCCERCHAASGGFLLEDSERVRAVFCLACLSALLRAALASLRVVVGNA
jgi:hypothetical protein